MGKQAAVNTYRESVYNAAKLQAQMRIDSRSFPIVGGFMSGLGLLGNAIARPFKVGGALIFGGDTTPPEFPAMPTIPEAFKGTDLEDSFKASWKLQEEAANARVKSFASLLNFEITKSWQAASVASHAEAKDTRVAFPEEGAARDAAAGGSLGGVMGATFVDSLSRGGSSGRMR